MKEFVHRGDYVHAMFESLARKMNSAQNMNPAIGLMLLSRLSPTLTKVAKVQLLKIQTDYPLI